MTFRVSIIVALMLAAAALAGSALGGGDAA